MSHPVNKLERFMIGNTKSKCRVKSFISYRDKKKPENQALLEKWAKYRRNTTKKCSEKCCGNPRKFFNEKTIQEIRYGGEFLYPD